MKVTNIRLLHSSPEVSLQPLYNYCFNHRWNKVNWHVVSETHHQCVSAPPDVLLILR